MAPYLNAGAQGWQEIPQLIRWLIRLLAAAAIASGIREAYEYGYRHGYGAALEGKGHEACSQTKS